MSLLRRRPSGARARARILQMTPSASGAKKTGALDVEQVLQLAVTAPDGTAFAAEYTCKVPHAKSPLHGDTIPVEIDPDARTVLRVVFDEMPDLAERAQASAAAALAGDSAGAAEALGFTLRPPDG